MIITIFIVIIVTIVTVVLLYKKAPAVGLTATTNTLVSSPASGKTQIDSNIDLPKAINQPQGLTFSYSCWLYFDNFQYRYGEEKVVFTKGPTDLSTMCPGVFLDANTNSLLVKLDTLGSREIVTVSALPVKKWIHLAIAVDQDSMDVYINGIIYSHKSFVQLPKENPSTVHAAVGGGFDGKIASLIYYPYFLKPEDVTSVMGSPPEPEQVQTSSEQGNLDITWWAK